MDCHSHHLDSMAALRDWALVTGLLAWERHWEAGWVGRLRGWAGWAGTWGGLAGRWDGWPRGRAGRVGSEAKANLLTLDF